MSTRKIPPQLVYLILAVMGTLLVVYFSRNGPGITGDSVHYVMGAQNLLEGRGFSRTGGGGEALPITGFPPGTSIVLVLAGLFTDDLVQGARILNSLFFGVNIYLVAQLVRKATTSFWMGLLAGLLIALSDDLILLHAWVMSEPQFILLMLLALWSVTSYIEQDRRIFLFIGGILIAVATLTRYVGVSLGIAAAFLLFFFGHGSTRRRLGDISLLGVVSALPVALWLWRNAVVSETLTNRGLSYFPLSSDLITAFLGTMNAWFFPLPLGLSTPIRAVLSTVVVLGIVGLFLWFEVLKPVQLKPTKTNRLPLLIWPISLYIPSYLVLLLVNSIFLDASTSTAGAARYLAPVFVSMVLLLTTMLARLMKFGKRRITAMGILVAVLCVTLVGSYTVRAVEFVRNPGEVFRYTDSKQAMPDVIEALNALDPSQLIVSNDIELVYVLIERPAYAFPITFDHYQQVYREDLEQQLDFVRGLLREGGRVIYFGDLESDDQIALSQLSVVEEQMFFGATLYRSTGEDG